MFLQGDKPTATLTRDRASRVLFDSDLEAQTPADTFVNFAYDHSTAEFNQLVQSKYSQGLESSAVPATDAQYNKYFTADTSYDTPGSSLQQYYNDTNPIPQQYQSFKPKVLTDYDSFFLGQKSEADEALLQKIDEVQIFEPKETLERVEFDAEVQRDTATEPYLKLNAKGLIACITFVAVTLLIITLIIINSISIGGASTQIRRLRDENTNLQRRYEHYDGLRTEALIKGLADANSFAGNPGLSEEPIRIVLDVPVSEVPLAPLNPDASTNLFNRIAKFLGSIFG